MDPKIFGPFLKNRRTERGVTQSQLGEALGVTSENHTLELWSAHFSGDHGMMWVYYSQEALDASGKTVCGSWRIPAYWVLEKGETGRWQVTGIKEAP